MRNALKVLLVEDDEDDQFLTRRILSLAGMTNIFHVGDGRLAVDYLAGQGAYADRTACPLPDLMLLDLKMPHMNGHQVLEWMKDRPELAGLKTFVLSSSGEERDLLQARRFGAAGYFVKPLMPRHLDVVLGGFALV